MEDGASAPLTEPVYGRCEFPAEAGSPDSATADYGMAANGASPEEVIALSALEILPLDGSGRFRPGEDVTRAQVMDAAASLAAAESLSSPTFP